MCLYVAKMRIFREKNGASSRNFDFVRYSEFRRHTWGQGTITHRVDSILSVFGEIMMVYGVQKFWTGPEIDMNLDLGEYSELDNKLGI